jgi:transposase-like protein
MGKSRRNHSGAFKGRAVLDGIPGRKSLAQIAVRHKVHAIRVTVWEMELLERNSPARPANDD